MFDISLNKQNNDTNELKPTVLRCVVPSLDCVKSPTFSRKVLTSAAAHVCDPNWRAVNGPAHKFVVCFLVTPEMTNCTIHPRELYVFVQHCRVSFVFYFSLGCCSASSLLLLSVHWPHEKSWSPEALSVGRFVRCSSAAWRWVSVNIESFF